MSASTAIGKVSKALQSLLSKEMDLPDGTVVTLLAPDEEDSDKRINLFLYKVQESPVLKNMEWQLKRGKPDKMVPPPLSINLFYLMTAYFPNDDTTATGNAPAHELLGEAMRVFYEYPVVPKDYADEVELNIKEEIGIMLHTPDLEELSKIWATFTKAYRLSVMYEVSVVQLDMKPDKEREAAPPVREIGVPDIRLPYDPPVVERIEPASGVTGTSVTVTVYGKHLIDWKPTVTLDGTKGADIPKLTADSFTFDTPDTWLPGFYEIRVDIPRICRRTFIFEVTEEQ